MHPILKLNQSRFYFKIIFTSHLCLKNFTFYRPAKWISNHFSNRWPHDQFKFQIYEQCNSSDIDLLLLENNAAIPIFIQQFSENDFCSYFRFYTKIAFMISDSINCNFNNGMCNYTMTYTSSRYRWILVSGNDSTNGKC